MTAFLEKMRDANVVWEASPEYPYAFTAVFDGKPVRLRLNDFPDEPLCTVIVDNVETDLHEFPTSWELPRHTEKPRKTVRTGGRR